MKHRDIKSTGLVCPSVRWRQQIMMGNDMNSLLPVPRGRGNTGRGCARLLSADRALPDSFIA
ncbi:hypothetical protein E2C01_007419 [Portunus trituberculatus]|uniref:Uncharacterized protein n=1 Tax=Portunus trituberculatus TaxID=210409 RepID=A0A5B7CZ73_PORTR|nr:hypothetical protein [Portunus trituberculatus]